jgi:LPS O-antigen subunit length determinant protein (WzzB/FepE family)
MCSLILNDLKGYNESLRFKKAQRKKGFLEKNLVAFKDSLRKAEQSLVYFYKSNKDFASPLLKLKEQRLRRGVDHQFQLVSEFLRQLEMAKVEVEKESEPLVIIQKPSFPIEKASPKRKVIALMGLLGGVGFAICFVLIQSWYRDNKDDFIRDK